jgi:outer membrane protein
LLPVLDAQRDLYLARRDYAQSRYEYLISRLKLKQAAGTLSETDLVGISAALK